MVPAVLRKCDNCAQAKVNYVQKVYYAHYVVLIIDDSGQVKGETCEMWIYHSHLEYEHSYHQVCTPSIMHYAKDNGEPVKSNTHSCHKLMGQSRCS